MFECAARFNNGYWIKVAINPENGTDNEVVVEQIVDGEKIVATGTITFNVGEYPEVNNGNF